MANVIGSGIARVLVDIDGDPVNVTGTAIDVNIRAGIGYSTFLTYPQFAVGTTLVQLSSGDGISYVSALVKEMIIQADRDNSSYVMVGDSGILASDVDGIRINAGDTLTLPFSNTAEVYFRSGTADQKVNVSLLM